MNAITVSKSILSIMTHLAQLKRQDIQALNEIIMTPEEAEGATSSAHQNPLIPVVLRLFSIKEDSKFYPKIQSLFDLNKNHALTIRNYPNLLKYMWKMNPDVVFEHILQENAPSEFTIFDILESIDLSALENAGKKTRKEITNLFSVVFDQTIGLPDKITNQFVKFLKTYQETIKKIFNQIQDPNDPKLMILTQQYIPQQDAKSILKLQEDSLDPTNSLEQISFGNEKDKQKILNALQNKDPFSQFFANTFIPAFLPQSTPKVYIYDLYIWGYYNQDQFRSIVGSKSLNRNQILQTLQQQTLDWMTTNLEQPPQNIKIYDQGDFPAMTNGKDPEDPDFLQIRNLHTSLDLIMESNTMNHCAGGFHQTAVEAGEEQFYSVQNALNQPKATIVIKKNPKGFMEVSEIRGHNNSRPDTQYMLFAGEFLDKNGIKESDEADFYTGYKGSKQPINDNEIEGMLYHGDFKGIHGLIYSKQITPQIHPNAFWVYFIRNISSLKSFIMDNKIITPESEPTLFNYLVFGTPDGSFDQQLITDPEENVTFRNQSKKNLDESFVAYIYDKIDRFVPSDAHYYNGDQKQGLKQNIDDFYISYVPLVYSHREMYPDEGAKELYDMIFEENIEPLYPSPSEEDWREERLDDIRYQIEENEDREPTQEDIEFYMESEDFDSYVESDKQEWIDRNFPANSFMFPSNQMLMLKGIVRPDHPAFQTLFDSLKQRQELLHKDIKMWVLKSSAISRNPNYIDYYHNLADHWLKHTTKNSRNASSEGVQDFDPDQFAAIAIYTGAISRLDGMDRLKSFLSTMTQEDQEWGYNTHNTTEILNEGILSRLDYHSDSDAKLDYINNIRKINPIDAFQSGMVDEDIFPQMSDELVEYAQEKHDKLKQMDLHWQLAESRKNGLYDKLYDIIKRSSQFNPAMTAFAPMPPEKNLEKTKKILQFISESPEKGYNAIDFWNNNIAYYDFSQQCNTALNTMIANENINRPHIQSLFTSSSDFVNMLNDKFPEKTKQLFELAMNAIKKYPDTFYKNTPTMLNATEDIPYFKDPIIDEMMSNGDYTKILFSRKLSENDPRKQEIIEKSFEKIKSRKDYSIYLNDLKDFVKTITPQDAPFYNMAVNNLLKSGELLFLISEEILTPQNTSDKEIQELAENDQYWEQVSKHRPEYLRDILLNMDGNAWGPIYSKLLNTLIQRTGLSDPSSVFSRFDDQIRDLVNKPDGLAEQILKQQKGYSLLLLKKKLVDRQELFVPMVKDAIYNSHQPSYVAINLFTDKTITRGDHYGPDAFRTVQDALSGFYNQNHVVYQLDTGKWLIRNGYALENEPLYTDIINFYIRNNAWNYLETLLPPEKVKELMQQNNFNPNDKAQDDIEEFYNNVPKSATPPPQDPSANNDTPNDPTISSSLKNTMFHCATTTNLCSTR